MTKTPPFVFTYPARIDQWHDGDTCYVHLFDRPGREIHGEHVRVEGINAPELHDTGGIASRDYAAELAPVGSMVTLTATKEDKYGRLLARVVLPDGTDLSTAMIDAGMAKPYLS